MIRRSFPIVALLALLAGCSTVSRLPATQPASQPDASIDSRTLADTLREILHRNDSTGATFVARVIEAPSGRELYAERANVPVIPASNMKLPVSAAFLDRFGPNHGLTTTLALVGDDLWLVGTGDPATGDAKLAEKRGDKPTTILDRWSAALKARGVSHIPGNLHYFDGAFDDMRVHPTWSRSYLTDWYAAPVAGLNFNDNCVDVMVRPAERDGEPGEYSYVPPADFYRIVNQTKTRGEGDLQIEREPNADVYTIKGGVTAKKALESKAVTDPGAFFASALRSNLASHGIEVVGKTIRADKPPAVTPDQVVAVHETKVRDLLWRINKNSQNLFAEAACKYLGAASMRDQGEPSPRGSWEAGGEAVRNFLKRSDVDDTGYQFVDGSGLSRGNRVTAKGQSELLLAMSRHPHADVFRESLAIAGRDGTIGSRLKDVEGRVFAKTGFISGVRALSGYVHTRSGKWLVFSIIYNDIPGSVKPFETLQDEACRALVNHK